MTQETPPPALPLDILIVGPGRLGRSIARLLEGGPHRVRLVGRQEAIPPAPVVYLTVPDRVIGEVAAKVPPGGVLLHASGATGIEPLRPHAPAGSLHPLMSFPGPELGLPDPSLGIPAAVAGDPEAITVARQLALALGFTPFEVPGDRRLYHAAAVMAGNFSTALLAEASLVLARAGVPEEQAPALLAPLAIASIRNAARSGTVRALTGPVARGDDAVLAAHMRAFSEQQLPGRVQHTYRTLLEAARALLHRDRN